MINVNCKQCNGEFKTIPSIIKKGEGKFCSRKCHNKWMSENLRGKNNSNWKEKISVKCLVCSRKFLVIPYVIKIGSGKYCSRKCYWTSGNYKEKNANHWRGGELSVKCLICLKYFQAKPSNVKRGKGILCSNKCRAKWQGENKKGEKSHFWRGGKMANYPEMERIRKSPEYKQWAKTIKERDNYICQICETKKAYFHSNHIKRFVDYPELRFDLKNGITICRDCDHKFVMGHEENCEDFFNFNLIERGFL